MADLREQAQAIINVCETASGKSKEKNVVDNATIVTVQEILAAAKAQSPEDKVLASVKVDPPIHFWTTIQTAMEVVKATAPSPKSQSLAEAMEQGRKRVEALEKPISGAIAEYQAALKEYEQGDSERGYSMIEMQN